ncbi:MAG TPA: TIGR03084 family metal-binding protein, partial [Trebonia sp.]|nr:TIGR03084 family metal-binding protein [Trebonia sp.]
REVLAWFDRSRTELTEAFRTADPDSRLPWFGPAMSPASSVTARLMETWAHGTDILDTFGIDRVPTTRLRHIADLGIRALRYTYAVNGLERPGDPIRVELAAPDGQRWTWGPDGARDRVAGDALDFCLVVTQRRHRDDTGLDVRGPVAAQWIAIAQAFAGPAGPGRAPGHVKAPAAARAAASPGGR